MLKLAASLIMLWPELPLADRFRAAAEAGFRHVEMLFPQELDPGRLEHLLAQLDLRIEIFNSEAGSWNGGERGIMCLPGRESEFLASVETALELAGRFGTTKINTLVGIPPPSLPANLVRRTALENLRRAADLAANAGVELLIENINDTDVVGYWVNTTEKAVGLIRASGYSNVRLLLDQYHANMAGEDAVVCLNRNLTLISHIQIADVPGRHQPGTGAAPIGDFLSELAQSSYDGCVGLEYRPLGSTNDSLAWVAGYLRPRSIRDSA